MPSCKAPACRALIFYAVWQSTGKPHPVDAQPVDDGDLVLITDEAYEGGRAVRKATADDPPGPRYKSHFATCIKAHMFRGKR